MREDAKIATLIELVDKSVHNPAPADNMLKDYFRTHRFIGSKDRRSLTNMLWDILRNRYALEHKANSAKARNLVIAYLEKDYDLDLLFTGLKYAPEAISKDELNFNNTPTPPEISSFLLGKLKETFHDTWEEELKALNLPARFDLRANTLKAPIELIKEKTKAIKTPLSKLGLYFEEKFNITQTDDYKNGLIDIQDEGSQLICEFCEAKSGDKILDICCGSGGKSLTLAILMNNKGAITAYDKYKNRMKDLEPRANRSGISIINTNKFENKRFDMVVIDAPCSGAGTIRRNVDRKWKITPETIEELVKTQAEILQNASKYSDKIIYATCSFLREENQDQVANFIKNNPNFKLTKEQLLSPAKNNTDAFYMAQLIKK